MATDGQPCLNQIIKHTKKLNQKWNLNATPGQAEGVQVSFQEIVTQHIKRLKANGVIQNGEMVKIKLSGDGTSIGKRINVVNITYVYHLE